MNQQSKIEQRILDWQESLEKQNKKVEIYQSDRRKLAEVIMELIEDK